MKRFLIAAAAVSTLVAAPAFAQDFSGPRVGVELGMFGDDVFSTQDTTYGVNVGYDYDLGSTVFGVTGSYTGIFNDNNADFRELGISARAGIKPGASTLVYGTAGYSNIDTDFISGSLDGVKVGLGVEQSFGNLFANVETRYGNYEAGVETYQTVLGVGYRF